MSMTAPSEDAPEARRASAARRPRSKRIEWRRLYARAQSDPARLCVSIGAVLWTVERQFRPGMSFSARLGSGLGLATVRSSCAVPLLVLLLSAVEGVDPLRSIGWAGASLWGVWTTLVVGGILVLAAEPLLVVGLMTLVCTFAVAEASLLGLLAQDRAPRARVRRRPA
jgi:hypothetical protein